MGIWACFLLDGYFMWLQAGVEDDLTCRKRLVCPAGLNGQLTNRDWRSDKYLLSNRGKFSTQDIQYSVSWQLVPKVCLSVCFVWGSAVVGVENDLTCRKRLVCPIVLNKQLINRDLRCASYLRSIRKKSCYTRSLVQCELAIGSRGLPMRVFYVSISRCWRRRQCNLQEVSDVITWNC